MSNTSSLAVTHLSLFKKEIASLAIFPGVFSFNLYDSEIDLVWYEVMLNRFREQGFISGYWVVQTNSFFNLPPKFFVKVGWLNWFKLKFATLK